MITSRFENIFSEENKINSQSKMKLAPMYGKHLLVKNFKYAAVLVPLCYYKSIPSLIFCQRSANLVTNRGEVCFPGGLKEDGDASLIDTAIRETREEIGLRVDKNMIWGCFSGYVAQNLKVMVIPVLANMGEFEFEQLHENRAEVAFTFVRSIESLVTSPAEFTRTRWRLEDHKRIHQVPVFNSKHPNLPRIWGLTAIMLDMTLSLLLSDWQKRYNLPGS